MLQAVVSGAVLVCIEVAKCLFGPIGRQFSYLCNFKTNFDTLKHEVKKLMDERESVQHRVDAAARNGEETEQKVKTWLTRVDKIMNESRELIEDEEKAKKQSSKGLCNMCPYSKTRYQLSKDAVRKVKAVTKLQEEGKFDQVSYRTTPQEIWLSPTKGYESFESRMETLRDIEKELSDPNVNMIGVYGVGGIGKTTLVKEIARQAENDKLFDEVIFTDVSLVPNIKKIQEEIGDKLGLGFREETESGRARKLRERLSGVKKILIVLDNICKGLDMEAIGIPFGDDHKGCKVLLTARSEDVLVSEMNCERNFLLSVLSEEETWSLFKKMVGECIENGELQYVAIDVAKECGGLPITIITVARELQNKSIFEWKNALQELRRQRQSKVET